METTDYEGGTGGKLRRRPLRRVPSTPYERPPLEVSGINGPQPETEAGGSSWFSKLVDPASRVIVRSASRLLSVLGEDLTAPPGEHINTIGEVIEMISDRGFDAPLEIARAYMGSMLRKAAPSTLGLQRQIYKASPLNLQFGNKPSIGAIASRSAACFPVIPTNSGNDCMAQNPRGNSALYKISRSHCRSFKMTNTREYSPYEDNSVEPTMSLEWTTSPSNIRHPDHGQALKRGRFGDARRVHQMPCLKDSNTSTHLGTSSTFFIGQEYQHDIDLKGPDNVDAKTPSHFLHVPRQSTEMARKILLQLDKLNPSPQSKLSKKKVIAGDASFSKSSLSASHEGSLKFKAINGSSKLLEVQGERNLEEPSSSDLARIMGSSSPAKDKVEGEISQMPYTAGVEAAPCSGIYNSDTSASIANHSMKSMDSNSYGLPLLSRQKEPAIQSALNDKVGSVKTKHAAILASVKEPMEKSLEHSNEYVHTFGLMHTDSDTKAFDKAFTESNASYNLLAAHTYNTLSKPLSSMATTLAVGAPPKMENSVSPLQSGSKVSTYNATKPISTGVSERLNAGSLSVVSSSTDNEVPKFHFGLGNSTSYSFKGVSAISSGTDSGSFSTFVVFPPMSASGAFGVSTSSTSGGSNLPFANSSYQNPAIKFDAGTTSSCGTWGISYGDGANNFTRKPVFQFGTLDSYAKSRVGSS